MQFTEDVLASLKRRSKAIKHRGALVAFDRLKEVDAGTERKSNRMDVKVSYAAVNLRVVTWDDRWVWMDVRRSSKRGWIWSVTTEGRFVGVNGAPDLVQSIEATLDMAHEQDPRSRIASLWKAQLAQGPVRL
jgi:hypothetical protein